LNVKEEDFPEKYRPIIRRLQAAAQEKTLRNKMIAEDDYLTEMNEYEEEINELEKKVASIEEEKQKLQLEKEAQKLLAEQERQKAEQERQKAEQERQKAEKLEQEKVQTIRLMIEMGIPLKTIQEKLNINEEFLRKNNLIN
jgi:predicted  nucleic acid-binding Zn-ribbon protein